MADRTGRAGNQPADGDVKVEYGQLYSSGGYLTFNDNPAIERIYPMADRIKAGQQNGGRVFRRRIVVIEDWQEVNSGE